MNTTDCEHESPAWSQPRHIADGVMINKPVVLADGDWLFAAHDRKTADMGLIKAVVSTDGGRSFAVRGHLEASQGLHAIEPMPVVRKDGSLWMLMRTGNAGDLASPQGIWEAVSTDRGASWTQAQPTLIKHTASRFYVGRLQSGNLLLVKHCVIDVDLAHVGRKQRRELMAFVSRDDGRNWSRGMMIDDRLGCSYPDAQQTADGTIHVTWDFNRSKDQEILLTTFREEDVLTSPEAGALRARDSRRLVSGGGTGR